MQKMQFKPIYAVGALSTKDITSTISRNLQHLKGFGGTKVSLKSNGSLRIQIAFSKNSEIFKRDPLASLLQSDASFSPSEEFKKALERVYVRNVYDMHYEFHKNSIIIDLEDEMVLKNLIDDENGKYIYQFAPMKVNNKKHEFISINVFRYDNPQQQQSQPNQQSNQGSNYQGQNRNQQNNNYQPRNSNVNIIE